MGAKDSRTPEVTIIGCGTPNPMPESFGSAYVVDIGGEKLLFDCGPATTWKLVRNGIAPTDINTVIFTHHHFDHDADFPTFILTRWDRSIPREVPLETLGPTLTEKFTNGILDEDTGLFAHDWKARVVIRPARNCSDCAGETCPEQSPLSWQKTSDLAWSRKPTSTASQRPRQIMCSPSSTRWRIESTRTMEVWLSPVTRSHATQSWTWHVGRM